MNPITKSSSNYTKKKSRVIKYIIIHYTGMSSASKSLSWLCNKNSKVSCHYFIDEKGKLFQLVDDVNIAWHAGISSWGKDRNLNKNSIGIEIQNKGEDLSYHKFSSKQIKETIELIIFLKQKYSILDCNILGHSDVAPDRKTDPGYLFPWDKLNKFGIGLMPGKIKVSRTLLQVNLIKKTQKLLKDFGYRINLTGLLDIQTILVLNSFQSHYCQNEIGQFDYNSSIIVKLRDLISQKNRCLTSEY
tara:strand:- start:1306 stop:2040 length:735 start_codon:yes stop_codon:yes gene_type:complete